MGCLVSTSVYWIHHPDHTDMFTQGYIGVSKNIKKRWRDHKNRAHNLHLSRAIKKYGWDVLIKKVVLVADEAYCLMIESQLREKDQIGWNMVKGGGMPPSTPWNKGKPMDKNLLKRMKANGFGFDKGNIPWNKGVKYTKDFIDKMYDIASYTRGKPAWNKGSKLSKDLEQKLHKQATCVHCSTKGNIGNITRYHMDNCKLKGITNVKH